MEDMFKEKKISPMLISQSSDPFDDPQFIFEVKWDGIRCLAYLDENKTDLRNKRNIKLLPALPELESLNNNVDGKVILDGEVIVPIQGKPVFEAIQRRSVMTDRLKISLEARKRPAVFVAYDILFHNGQSLLDIPLSVRKERLNKLVHESENLVLSRWISEKGIDFFHAVKQQEMEGVVGKKIDSRYRPGSRTRDWIKIKVMQDDDFVICGYIYKAGGMISLILGQYNDSELLYQGHVTLGVSGEKFRQIKLISKRSAAPLLNYPVSENKDAIWLDPVQVCTVEFMYRSPKGTMRQPVLKGLRNDKKPVECTVPTQ